MNPAVPAVLALALVCAHGAPARSRIRAISGVPGARRRTLPSLRFAAPVGGAVLGAVAAGVAGGIVGAAAAEVVRRRRRAARGRAEAARTTAELAEALDRIVEELRSGAHPAAALDGVGSDGPRIARALGPAAAAARLGDDVPAALRRAAGDAGPIAPELERLSIAWGLAERHGAPLASLLAGTLTDLRWRTAFTERVRARLAGPRATAGVLTALPVLGLGLGHLLGAGPLTVLRGGLLGQGLLLAGAGLLIAGVLWADRIATGPVA